MERSISSPRSTNHEGLLSCWGCLKLKLPWKRRAKSCFKSSRQMRRMGKAAAGSGGFRYDPLSYAQNFDDGWDEDDTDLSRLGFSARFAAPLSKPIEDNHE